MSPVFLSNFGDHPNFLFAKESKTNKKIYEILIEYFKISKIPTLINTSFNVHEEPIVCEPDDAMRAFLKSGLDYLYIEDYIVYP